MKKLAVRTLCLILCMVIMLTLIPEKAFAADSTDTYYREDVIRHYEEDALDNVAYARILSETGYLYKEWADEIYAMSGFTQAYLTCTQFLMAKNLNKDAYVDYLGKIIALTDKSFLSSTAAQATYTAHLTTGDKALGVVNIAVSELLGGIMDQLEDCYNLMADIEGFEDLATDMITNATQLQLFTTAVANYQQKCMLLETVRDNTDDRYLKEAAEELLELSTLEFIYIYESQVRDLAWHGGELIYHTMDECGIVDHMKDTLYNEFPAWLKTKVDGDRFGSLLKSAGKIASYCNLFATGFSIGTELMRLFKGNESECFREMLAMDKISDALAKGLQDAKTIADGNGSTDQRYEAVVACVYLGKALMYAHMRGEYADMEARDGKDKEAAKRYYAKLMDEFVEYEKRLSYILLEEKMSVVSDRFVLKDGFIDAVTTTQTVPSGYIPIYSFADWEKLINGCPTEDERKLLNDTNTASYILMNDITMPNEYESVHTFGGILEGNGYTISNISTPLFSTITDAEIRNLSMEVSTYITWDDRIHDAHFGTLAQFSTANIYGTFYTKTNYVTNCTVSGYINFNGDGTGCIAGFVSEADHVIFRNCCNEANIAYASTMYGQVGGFTSQSGIFFNCLNKGDLSAQATEETGGCSIGGISGYFGGLGVVEQCVNTANLGNISVEGYVNSGSAAGGLVGDCRVQSFLDPFMKYCVNEGNISANCTYSDEAAENWLKRESFGVTAGGLLGYNNNCRLEDCLNLGNVYGSWNAGGLCGRSVNHEIYNCLNKGSVEGRKYIGGLVGSSVQKVTIQTSINLASINGSGIKGSLAAKLDSAKVTECYYLEDGCPAVAECKKTIDATALDADQMKYKANFVGFDFCSVWSLSNDAEHPFLRFWEVPEDELRH